MTIIKGKGYLSFNKFFKSGRIKKGDKLVAWFHSITKGRYQRTFKVMKDGRLAEYLHFDSKPYMRTSKVLKNKTWQLKT